SDANIDGFKAPIPDDDDRTDVMNIQTNSTQTEVLTPVISNKLKLKFYFLEICDKEIAKQNNPSMGDIFLNRDLHNIQFREYFNPVMEFEYDIKCEGCQYELHDFVFCLDLEKIKVCQLDNDDLSVAKTFNIGKYAFVFVIDYFNWMYQFKIKSGNDDVIKFGETFNSETELKEDGNLDKEIQNSNLNKKQKSELQTLYINQERMIIRYNEIKTRIEEETKINRLKDFQFWYMQITSIQNLTDRLKEELQKMRKDRFDFLVDYIAKFNRIQQRIQDKTEIERLKDFWFSEITKSKLENNDKQKLNELREKCIRELEQTQLGTNNFNYIRDEICNEKEIPNLEVNRHWFREIRNSRNLSEEQKVALNIQRDKKLKTLSNEKYNTLLYDVIENEMKEDNNKQSFEDSEKYDLLIQTLEGPFLDSLHTKKIDNINDAFEFLFNEKGKYKNKVSCLIQELLLSYIQKFPYTAEIYKDNEHDQYFIDKSNKQFHSIYEIEDIDEFVNNIIKKNYLYKTIKEIFDQENGVITFSKIVEPNDNE
ncbi:5394_t:CDS:2, partial [Cetraspora pellucida]